MERKTDIPPIQTLAEELILWTLNHTSKLPKSQRFTFGQRLDNTTLDLVEKIAEARFSSRAERVGILQQLNVILEKLRVLWRIIHAKEWMSDRQSRHVHERLNEIGRMAGHWIKASGQK